MLQSIFALFSLFLVVNAVSFSTKLSPDNFDAYVGLDKGVFVMYTGPDSDLQDRAIEVWNQISHYYHGSDLVRIATMDCVEHASMCQSKKITSTPTFHLFYPKDRFNSVRYGGFYTEENLRSFIQNRLKGTESAPDISENDLQSQFQTPSGKDLYIFFYTTTCQHCNEMEPVFDTVVSRYQSYSDKVEFAKVGVDRYPQTARGYNIVSFPEVLYISADRKRIKLYGTRISEHHLSTFINKNSGIFNVPVNSWVYNPDTLTILKSILDTWNTDTDKAFKLTVEQEQISLNDEKKGVHRLFAWLKEAMDKVVSKDFDWIDGEQLKLERAVKNANTIPSLIYEYGVKLAALSLLAPI